MHARETTTTSRHQLLQRDLVLLGLEIAIPVGVVDLIDGAMLAGRVSAVSIFRIPLYDWATFGCAVWVLLVLNRGPFAVPRSSKNRAEE